MKKWIYYTYAIACALCGLGLDARVEKVNPTEAARPAERMLANSVYLPAGDRMPQGGINPELAPSPSSRHFDPEVRKKATVALVEKGVAYLKDHSLSDSLNKFIYDKNFSDGEIYLFVYDLQGTCLSIGNYKELIWQPRYDYRDQFGVRTVYEITELARKGGGWLTYYWYGATKISWIQKIEKDGVELAIGAGFYPHSKEDAVINLVKGAVTIFNRLIQEGNAKNAAFAMYGYPRGRFVLGDLYLYVISFTGEVVAHGELSGLIGTSGWDYQDAKGVYVNREIVRKLKESSNGIWIEYTSKGARKRTYAEKVVDKEGVEYFIACGYYPDIGRREVENLVAKGAKSFLSEGLSPVLKRINDTKNIEFKDGDAYLTVFDQQGNCLGEGINPDSVGRNMYNDRDEDGRLYVQEIIRLAQEGGGWIDFKLRNSFISMYVELVNLAVDRYIVCSGLYPATKFETMALLVKSASDFLRNQPQPKDAFKEFVRTTGSFIRGDLFVYVFDDSGICLVYGDEFDYIWKDFSKVKIDDGRLLMTIFKETASQGSGTAVIKMGGKIKVISVQKIVKDKQTFYIGSGFYK